MKKTAAIAFFAVAILILVGIAWFLWSSWKAPQPQTASSTLQTPVVSDLNLVSQVVTDFGNVLQNVPLSGDRQIASQAMDQNYAPYLSANLLMQWKDDPSQALGRATSSPWPARIEIEKLVQTSDNAYEVSGDIIFMTSDDVAKGTQGTRQPVTIRVENIGGHWLITNASTSAQQADQHQSANQALFAAPNLFTVAYPMEYPATTGTGLGGANLDYSWVSISIPEGEMDTTGTNFVEAYAVVSESTSTDMLKKCTSFTDIDDKPSTTTQIDVNGVTFAGYETGGAAAGNLYTSHLYRTVYENACYEVALVVHTGNIGNYEAKVKEFDQKQAFDRLMAILQSFRFE
jgi:hypothetical protein